MTCWHFINNLTVFRKKSLKLGLQLAETCQNPGISQENLLKTLKTLKTSPRLDFSKDSCSFLRKLRNSNNNNKFLEKQQGKNLLIRENFKKTLESSLQQAPRPDNFLREVYERSSSREIKQDSQKLCTFLEDSSKHRQILAELRRISASELLKFEDFLENRAFSLRNVEKIAKNASFRGSSLSINQLLSPQARVLQETGFELSSKANKYNVHNKRVTLNSFIAKQEVDEQLRLAISGKTGGNSQKFSHLSQKNEKNTKKKYYNKWFVPVKLWKIPRKQQKSKFFQGFS